LISNINNFVPDQKINFYINAITSSGNFTLEIFFLVKFESELEHLNTISNILEGIKKVSLENNIVLINAKWVSDEDDSTSVGDYGAGG